jgi:predicted CXXCH cytochrome family protein
MGNKGERRLHAAVVVLTLTAMALGARTLPPGPPSRQQPIAFRHDLHAYLTPQDCTTCHTSPDRSQDAVLPDLQVCADCHIEKGAASVRAEKPEVQKLQRYWAAQKPVPWVSIYELPDHVHFLHLRHEVMNMQCQVCHGPVTAFRNMGLKEPLTMEWCIACHERLGARTDCVTCHY